MPANKNAVLFTLNYIRKGLLSCDQSIQNWVSVEAGDAGPGDNISYSNTKVINVSVSVLGKMLFCRRRAGYSYF
jgi:hypothetical protein